MLFVSDDILFNLFKRGFFGRSLRVATNNKHHIICSTRIEDRRTRRWYKRLIRAIYCVNMIIGMSVLTATSVKQRQGAYRCNSVMVDFGDAAWEQATVAQEDKKRLLIYSHFNGIYEEEGKPFHFSTMTAVTSRHLAMFLTTGRHDGRPRYVERNKEDGAAFKEITPAEIGESSVYPISKNVSIQD
jgi:hypothetical protein